MNRLIAVLFLVAGMVVAGCGGSAEEPGGQAEKPAPPAPKKDLITPFFAEEPLDGLAGIAGAIEEKDFGEEITVTGMVGEIQNGFAAFRIVDMDLTHCYRDEESCDTPWDYC